MARKRKPAVYLKGEVSYGRQHGRPGRLNHRGSGRRPGRYCRHVLQHQEHERPRERAFAIRAAALCWLGVSAFLACLFLLPLNWRLLLWVVYLPSRFWFIRWANERQAGARVEDMTQADLPGRQAGGL